MIVWRLTRPDYAVIALLGEGSARYPGRWNPRGMRVAYASETLSLASLEILAHAENLAMLSGYVALSVELPDDSMTSLSLDELPEDWQSNPPPDSTRRLGLAWYEEGKTLALKVPSVLIPSEHNFVINPSHPRFAEVKVAEPVALPFDARLLSLIATSD